MRVYMSTYRSHWLSPYVILEKFFFWRKGYDVYESTPPKWLQSIMGGIQKFLDIVHPRIQYVKIDEYDLWDADHTLGKIILPMLKMLRESKEGAPNTDDEDVPEILRSTSAPEKEHEWDTDANHFLRWDWILSEEIFAFESLFTDWALDFTSGVYDIKWVKGDGGLTEMTIGPNHTYETDYVGVAEYQKRIDNGFRLWGKYFQAHWC